MIMIEILEILLWGVCVGLWVINIVVGFVYLMTKMVKE